MFSENWVFNTPHGSFASAPDGLQPDLLTGGNLDRPFLPDVFDWLKQKAEISRKAFAARVKTLPIEGALSATGEENRPYETI